MIVAYLVLAHRHPGQVRELVDALSSPRARFFVHVDAKAALAPFREVLPESPTVTYVEPRHRVNWACFSMVDATLSLLRAARGTSPVPDRYVLTSADSVPLMPTAELEERLQGASELLDAAPVLAGHEFLQRIERYHLADHPLLNRHAPGADREREWSELCAAVATFVDGLPEPGPLPMRFCTGSQWWALTRGAVDHVLSFVDAAPNAPVVWRFRHSHAPDESFFQSVLYDSRFSERLEPAPHYVDWTAAPGEHLPRTLTEAHHDAVLASGRLFARKIDPVRSAALVERLRRHVARAG